MKTLYFLFLSAAVAMTGCSDRERGYRHLMLYLDKHDGLSTCERLQLDGSTCYELRGLAEPHKVCAKTRDRAAELAAEYFEQHEAEKP